MECMDTIFDMHVILTLSLDEGDGAGVLPVHSIQLVLVGEEPGDELWKEVRDRGGSLHW